MTGQEALKVIQEAIPVYLADTDGNIIELKPVDVLYHNQRPFFVGGTFCPVACEYVFAKPEDVVDARVAQVRSRMNEKLIAFYRDKLGGKDEA